MNILYVLSSLQKSGPVIQLYDLIKHIVEHNKITIIIFKNSTNSMQHEFEKLGVNVLNLNSSFRRYLKLKNEIVKNINVIAPDIIHTQGFRPDLLLSILKPKVNTFSTVHNFPQLDYKYTYGTVLGFFMSKIHFIVLNSFTRCIGVSASVTDNLENNRLNNVITIENGVDTSYFYHENNKKELREKLNLPLDKTIWVTSGHLTERKNPLFLVNKFKQLNDSEHLILLGDGDLYEEVLASCSEVKNIHLLGRVENVREFLQASDYILSASKAEGLPLSIIEGMACGLPVLLSAIPPHQEILMQAKVGELFELDSENDFFTKIDSIKKSEYKSYILECERLIGEKMNSKKMASRYLSLYGESL